MMTVDEAHYAKNPNALRTQAVSEWAGRSRRALFLTGTPMENKVQEFRVLVGHLRPEVAEKLDITDETLDGTRFREQVAPVYLRRNTEDVLSELPGRLETQEWVALEGAAMRAYRQAVIAGNFMAMRRAAFGPGTVKGSPKLRRLVELVSCCARTASTSESSNCWQTSARHSTSTHAVAAWRTRHRTRQTPAPKPNCGARSWPPNAHGSRLLDWAPGRSLHGHVSARARVPASHNGAASRFQVLRRWRARPLRPFPGTCPRPAPSIAASWTRTCSASGAPISA
jgi:SNF2-related domain